MTILNEVSRNQLLAQSKNDPRYKRKSKSNILATANAYNKVDMNKLFKDDILECNVPVKGETDNYTITISYEGVIEDLKKEIKLNKNQLDLRCCVQALQKAFNRNDIYIRCTCLHPDTKIKLLDGTIPSVKEMCDRFDNGEQLWVYSTDSKGDFKPGKVQKVWETGKVNKLIKVTLDNDEVILTTHEHLYMMRSGEYKRADELIINDSLMPLYFRNDEGTNYYERVKINSSTNNRNYKSVYKLVAEELKQEEIKEAELRAILQPKNVPYNVAIHHKDFNKENNNPDNLEIMTGYEHWDYHSNKGLKLLWQDKDWAEKNKAVAREYAYKRNSNPTEAMKEQRKNCLEKGRLENNTEKCKVRQSKIMKNSITNYWLNMTAEQREAKVLKMSIINKEIAKKRILNIFNKILNANLEITYENYKLFKDKTAPLITKYFDSINEAVSYFKLNHRVKFIEYITLDSPISVYDIKVEKYENFLVNAGVVLHNCPDFQYRFSYWSTIKHYISHDAELRPPEKTNPYNDKGIGCKHILLCLSRTLWILKVASVLHNYIKYMQRVQTRLYDKLIATKIYDELPEEPDPNQISFDDIEPKEEEPVEEEKPIEEPKYDSKKEPLEDEDEDNEDD